MARGQHSQTGFVTLVLLLVAIFLTSVFAACHVWFGVYREELGPPALATHGEAARKLREKGEFKAAIEEYQKHIQSRLKDPNRLPDENPYFYEIIIGNIYLDLRDPAAALTSYLTAKEHQVEDDLVLDGIIRVARFHEAQKEYEQAIDLLEKYREMDELIIDGDIDRIHRKYIESLDTKRLTTAQ